MYSTIKTYLGTLITAVNSGITGTSNDLREADLSLDNSLLPSNLKDKSYQIYIEEVEDLEYETTCYNVNVSIEFWFLMANARGNYETAIDTYLRAFLKQLKTSSGYEGTSFAVGGVEKIKITGIKNFPEAGNYLNPTISMTLKCIDTL